MKNLFLNYDAHTDTVTVNTYRNQGYFGDICDLVENVARGISTSCNLEGALDAVRDGAAWAGTNATPAVLEMIDVAICEFEENTYDN